MNSQGLQIVGSTPDQMMGAMRADTTKWSNLIQATGIKLPQ
jgi:hypothetical protein